MSNPYTEQHPRAFWAGGVAKSHFLDIGDLWKPKWPILPSDKVITFGSCFAQHFSRAMSARGYNWQDFEPAPVVSSPSLSERFNYGIFSARTGNIYTSSLLRQWLSWAFGASCAPEEIWEKQGRVYDPFRPRIEPNGFSDKEELLRSRDFTLAALRQGFREADVLVFTLGLTETWLNTQGHEYPMCPGTVAGTFDADIHKFKNLNYTDVRDNLLTVLDMVKSENPDLRVLLTVSPVPLTATATDEHVLVATSYSKSVLRAVAGDIAASRENVDYFPSYEIISSPVYRGTFFDPNLRSVNAAGVRHVMEQFFAAQPGASQAISAPPPSQASNGGIVCEEELLSAFGGRA